MGNEQFAISRCVVTLVPKILSPTRVARAEKKNGKSINPKIHKQNEKRKIINGEAEEFRR